MHFEPVSVENTDDSVQSKPHDNLTQTKAPSKDKNIEEIPSSVSIEQVNGTESAGVEEVPTQPEENCKIYVDII